MNANAATTTATSTHQIYEIWPRVVTSRVVPARPMPDEDPTPASASASASAPTSRGGVASIPPSRLLSSLHADFIQRASSDDDAIESALTDHLRVSGAYWGLTAMALLGRLDEMDRDGVLAWLARCYDAKKGGYGGNEGHDAHLLYTLSAVQIYALFDRMDLVDADAVAAFAGSLQRDDGSFAGDEWGEIDTRFSYCALCLCKLCGRMDAIDVDAAAAFVDRCKNWDGGYGAEPGGESHAGQIFVCVAALEIAGGDAPGTIDREALGWWLCERQVKAGGLNGRPEKLPDVCYGWWVLSALSILNKLEWIDADALARFILDAQDGEKGGIADRPSDEPDVFHTFFGVAGLSLLGFEGLRRIDPTYALPADVVQRMGLRETGGWPHRDAGFRA